MTRHALSKRGEISTPIITILVTVAALAVTGVAISWMVSAGTSAASQGAAIIVGSPVIQSDTLYMTVKNIGNANTTITACRIGSEAASTITPAVITPGDSRVLEITFGESFTAGSTVKGALETNQGILQFSAYVQ
ncbi:MAG TPA: hypothetical protein PKX17_02055 [Candidatus Methanomethylicus sp.]|nr:hypothetical protein [Candidatus Methanomethylicus sp.]